MYPIPNTSIIFQNYDVDGGRIPPPQTWNFQQPIVGGYLFCSTAAVFVRLTVGPTHGQTRQLPEFFLPPGAQGVNVDYKSGGNYVWAVEVRAATSTAAQFWGALATANDPIGGYTPASYAVDSTGAVVPVTIVLTFEQDGVVKGSSNVANFIAVGGVPWALAPLAGSVNIPVPPIGFQHNDAAQLNEVIADFEDPTGSNAGVLFTLTDDAANHRVKISGVQRQLITHDPYTADVTITATTEGTATTIVTSTSKTYDGVTPVLIMAFVERINFGAASATTLTPILLRDATEVCRMSNIVMTNGLTAPGTAWYYRETPAAGAHTYSLRAFGNVTGIVVGGGAGGGAVAAPGFIRTSYDV